MALAACECGPLSGLVTRCVRGPEEGDQAPGTSLGLSQWPLMSVEIRPGTDVLCRRGTETQTDNTIISSWRLGPGHIMGHKSSKMEHGLSQADLNFLVKNTNRGKKEIKVGLRLLQQWRMKKFYEI